MEPLSVTLRDIATKLGVSHATVSRALRNDPRISSTRQAQIQKAAEAMGYRPNSAATILGLQRHLSKKDAPITSGLAWVNYRHHPQNLRKSKEFDGYWEGAYKVAEESGFRLEEFGSKDGLSGVRLQKVLLARGITGILLAPHNATDLPSDWDTLKWDHFCVVRIGYSVRSPQSPIVACNYLKAGILVAENMARLGYQRIGYVNTNISRHALFQSGLLFKQSEWNEDRTIRPLRLLSMKESLEKSRLSEWMRLHRPDSIFTDIPEMPTVLKNLGYRIPEDIGLATTTILDGNSDAGIDQHPVEIGKTAAMLLISMLAHKNHGIPAICRETLITSSWVDGSSLPHRP